MMERANSLNEVKNKSLLAEVLNLGNFKYVIMIAKDPTNDKQAESLIEIWKSPSWLELNAEAAGAGAATVAFPAAAVAVGEAIAVARVVVIDAIVLVSVVLLLLIFYLFVSC